MPRSEAKNLRLRALSTDDGIIAALAIDQRKSMRKMLAEAAGVPLESIPDAKLSEFKAAVTEALTPHASAVLLDPEYGLPASKVRSSNCGLILAYEMDGFENPRPNRMLALLPELSVHRLAQLGADGVKILLTYSPDDDPRANQAKHALIERIGCECEAVGLPFFLEPVGYDPGGLDVRSLKYARMRPDTVIRSMQEFSKPKYRVDVLKVEFPVNVAFIGEAYSRAEALEYFRRADAATNLPYIYLSAGVNLAQFSDSLQMAAEANANYAGVLCGRATWQDGAAIYSTKGLGALDEWLAGTGVANIRQINGLVQSGKRLNFH